MSQKNLEIALEKIELMEIENKQLLNQIELLNRKIYNLTNPSLYNNDKGLGVNVDKLIEDANKAMKKYTNKLKKEGLKYAKQKQSKG